MDPDEQWLQDSSATYARNAKYAVRHPTYQTRLSPGKEAQFVQWVQQNKIPFNVRDPIQDYDMRGYWQDVAASGGNESAKNATDGQQHYPDTYKTPYHHSFSNESKYANASAPAWINDTQLADPRTGDVVWDERYMGQPSPVAESVLPPARPR